jgi:hypothetical protein
MTLGAVTVQVDGGFAGDNDDYVIRLVLRKDPARKIADIRLSYELTESDQITGDARMAIGLRLGLPQLAQAVEAEGADEFLANPEYKVVRLTTDSVPKGAVDKLRAAKSCVFMFRSKTGLTCEASQESKFMLLRPTNVRTRCNARGHRGSCLRAPRTLGEAGSQTGHDQGRLPRKQFQV